MRSTEASDLENLIFLLITKKKSVVTRKRDGMKLKQVYEALRPQATSHASGVDARLKGY